MLSCSKECERKNKNNCDVTYMIPLQHNTTRYDWECTGRGIFACTTSIVDIPSVAALHYHDQSSPRGRLWIGKINHKYEEMWGEWKKGVKNVTVKENHTNRIESVQVRILLGVGWGLCVIWSFQSGQALMARSYTAFWTCQNYAFPLKYGSTLSTQ